MYFAKKKPECIPQEETNQIKRKMCPTNDREKAVNPTIVLDKKTKVHQITDYL